jgi:hypothetical protein
VPYLGRGSQSDLLKAFADANYKPANADLATIFVARMLRWVGCDEKAGTVAAVTPQNWLFLTSYKKLRERLLTERSFDMIARHVRARCREAVRAQRKAGQSWGGS